MRVWIESPFDNLPQEGFRKQRYWLMAEAFAAVGHEVTYWTTDFNHGTKARRQLGQAEVSSKIAMRLVPVPEYRKNVSVLRIVSHWVYARRLEARMRAEVGRPDLVVAATPTLGSAMAAMRFAHSCGARFVLDIQDAWPETFYRLLPPGFKWLGRILLFGMHRTARTLYREADKVSGVSERYRTICGRSDYHLAYHGI